MSRFDFASKYSEGIYNKCVKIEQLSEDTSTLGYAYMEAYNVIEMLMEYLGVLNKNYRLTISSLAEQKKLPEEIKEYILLIMKIRNNFAHYSGKGLDDEIGNKNVIEMLEQICKWAFIFKIDADSIDFPVLIVSENQVSVLQKYMEQVGEADLSTFILKFALNNVDRIKDFRYESLHGSYQNLYNLPVKIDTFSELKLLEETGCSMSIYEILDIAMQVMLKIANNGTDK